MHNMTRMLTLVTAVTALGVAAPIGSQAQTLTAVEKLYADLSKLDPKSRAKVIEDGAKKEGQVNLTMTIRSKLGRDHTALFRKTYPFVKADATELGSQDASEAFIVESVTGRNLTDITTLAVPDMSLILSKDLAARYVSPTSERILPQYKGFVDPEGRWTVWYWSEHGMSHNTKMLPAEKAPKSYEDLCNPAFDGQIAFEPANVRFLVGMYTMMGREKLREWMKCIGKLHPITQRGHTGRLTLMLAGDHMLEAGNYLYRGTQMQEKSPDKVPFRAIYEAPVFAYGAGWVINENTPHPYAAALLADWSVSDDSQKYMAKNYRGPLTVKHPYMPDSVQLVTFGLLDPKIIDGLLEDWNEFVSAKR